MSEEMTGLSGDHLKGGGTDLKGTTQRGGGGGVGVREPPRGEPPRGETGLREG